MFPWFLQSRTLLVQRVALMGNILSVHSMDQLAQLNSIKMFSRAICRLATQGLRRTLTVRPVYTFCANPTQVKAKLLKVVAKENDYETENYQRDESIDEFLKKVGFSLHEQEGDNRIELRKKFEDTEVIVSFQSRSPNQDEEPEQPEQPQQSIDQTKQPQSQEEQPEQDYQDFAEFTVYLKSKDGKVLCYECNSLQSEIQVNFVQIVSDFQKHLATPRFERGINEYAGPDFGTLDERLQTTLLQYLKSYGVNEELAAFVEHYSLDKEQRLYMSWLSQLKTFLSN